MGKGKGRRRRQSNYLAAHGGTASLPAPPTGSDLTALPSKLRRIITFKSSLPHGHDSAGSRKQTGSSRSHTKGLSQMGKRPTKQQLKKLEDASVQDNSAQEDRETAGHRETPGYKRKKRKWEDELQALSERFRATPMRKGLNDRKKRYLQDKKKKKKGLMHAATSVQAPLNQHERISFGEVVEAPPKLAFPKKQKTAAEERLRQQAITTYRDKKKWISRPGSHQPPPLTSMTEVRNGRF